MARPQRNQAACDELASHLNARLALLHPQPSWPEMAREINVASGGRIKISDEQIKKMHLGEVDPTTTSADFLLGIVDYYNLRPAPMRIADLGSYAEDRLGNILELAQKLKKMKGRPTNPPAPAHVVPLADAA